MWVILPPLTVTHSAPGASFTEKGDGRLDENSLDALALRSVFAGQPGPRERPNTWFRNPTVDRIDRSVLTQGFRPPSKK